MDKLEEYIRRNRELLDRYNPSSSIWSKISGKVRKDRTPVLKWISIAAMIIVILGSTLIFFNPGNLISYPKTNESNNKGPTRDNNQLRETEIYYTNMVNSLYREATPFLVGNPEIEKELVSDISLLDSICVEIKNDLKDNVSNQEVVEALIQNYRIKIHLLEDMLTILKDNEKNTDKNKNYEL
jgi:hypothetical protein